MQADRAKAHESLSITQFMRSTQLINIHVINNRAFRVLVSGIFLDKIEVLSAPVSVVDSCILGETIALLLANGKVIVPHPARLSGSNSGFNSNVYPDCSLPESLDIPYGGTRIAATADGEHLIAYTSLASALLLRYDTSSTQPTLHTKAMIRQIIEHYGIPGHIQITLNKGGSTFTIWQLHIGGTLMLNVRTFDPQNPFAINTIANFQIGNEKFNNCDIKDLQLIAFEDSNGVLVRAMSSTYYISLNSVIIGNLINGPQLISEDTISINTTRESGLLKVFLFCRSGVYKVSWNSATKLVICEPFQCRTPRMALDQPLMRVTFGVIEKIEVPPNSLFQGITGARSGNDARGEATGNAFARSVDENIVEKSSNTEQKEYCLEYDVFHAKKDALSECIIDSRKRPWKIISCRDDEVFITLPATPMKYMGKVSLKVPISSVLYVPEIDLMLITTIEGTTRCVFPPEIQFPVELEGRAIACKLIDSKKLLVIFSDHIETYCSIADQIWNLQSSNMIATQENGIVLKADIIAEHGVLLQRANNIEYVETETSRTVIDNAYVSGMNYCDDTKWLTVTVAATKSIIDDSQYVAIPGLHNFDDPGAVLVYNVLDGTAVTNNLLFDQIPSQAHMFNYNSMVVVFQSQGPIFMLRKNTTTNNWAVDEICPVDSSLKLSVCTSEYAIFTGFGVHAVTPTKGYRRLYDKLEKSNGLVSGVVEIHKNNLLACVVKDEVRFFAAMPSVEMLDMIFKRTKINSLTTPQGQDAVIPQKMLLVQSQRILIVYRGNECNFYDSLTLEPLLVSGLHVSSCHCIGLWHFEENGEKYEHVVFSYDMCMESYILTRVGCNVECGMKFRVAIGAVVHNLRFCGNAILSFDNRNLTKVIPSQNSTFCTKFPYSTEDVVCCLDKFIFVIQRDETNSRPRLIVLDTGLNSLVCAELSAKYITYARAPWSCSSAVTAFRDSKTANCRVILFINVLCKDTSSLIICEFFPDTSRVMQHSISFEQIRNVDYSFQKIYNAPGYESAAWESNTSARVMAQSNNDTLYMLEFPKNDQGLKL